MRQPPMRHWNWIEPLEVRRLLSFGDLDPTFGNAGRFVSSPDELPGFLVPTDLAVQADGKLLVSGFGLGDVGSVVRFNANGTLDKSFGDNGIAHSGFGTYIAEGQALAVGPNGQIAVAGKTGPFQNESPDESTLVVYNANGSLNTAFDGDGIVDAPRYPRGFTDVAFQGDGKILALGEKLIRYNTSGKPDPTFSGDGVVDVSGKKVLIDSNGKILVLGYFAIFRFNADGTPDTSFDFDGVLPKVKGTDMALATDGDILVAGNGPTGDLVSRFNPDGRNDVTFGSSGNTTVRGGHVLAITGGDIYAGSTVGSATIPFADVQVHALTQGGTLDSTFGSNGLVQTDFDQNSDVLVGLAIQNGKLVALASAEVPLQDVSGTTLVPALVRYQISNSVPQVPFSDSPVQLPGLIQAENFDRGGEGVAYHDTEAANLGGAYRTGEGVDIQKTSATDETYTVAFARAGEWLEYTVNVPSAGFFDVDFYVASLKAGGTFHLEVDGNDVTGHLTVPQSGDWNNYMTVTKTGVHLSAGQHVLRLALDTNGSIGYVGNFDRFRLRAATAPNPQTPFRGIPFTDGQRIQAEDFDNGGEGVAYHDTDPANLGGAYRPTEGVDLQPTTDTGGGFNVGFLRPGEWLEYTTDFFETGPFNLNLRVASQGGGGGSLRVLVDGLAVGTFSITDTGGWQSWKTLTKSVDTIPHGEHVVRLQMDKAGSTGFVVNLNWLEFVPVAAG